jgi:hypothetical protein
MKEESSVHRFSWHVLSCLPTKVNSTDLELGFCRLAGFIRDSFQIFTNSSFGNGLNGTQEKYKVCPFCRQTETSINSYDVQWKAIVKNDPELAVQQARRSKNLQCKKELQEID